MFLRIVCSRCMFSKLNLGDFCTMAAMLCAVARGGMIHFVLTWGTNSISPKLEHICVSRQTRSTAGQLAASLLSQIDLFIIHSMYIEETLPRKSFINSNSLWLQNLCCYTSSCAPFSRMKNPVVISVGRTASCSSQRGLLHRSLVLLSVIRSTCIGRSRLPLVSPRSRRRTQNFLSMF